MTQRPVGEPLSFRKMNGLGNEIVVVDLRGTKRVVSADEARAVASDDLSRFDQMMVLHDPKTRGTEAFIRIYNTDGSEAEACGNGMRCVSWLAHKARGLETFKFETRPGVLDVTVADQNNITVDMGTPRLPGTRSPWRNRSMTQSGSSCRSGRSMRRSCIRRRS